MSRQQGPQDAWYNGQSLHELGDSVSMLWAALCFPSGIIQMVSVVSLDLL